MRKLVYLALFIFVSMCTAAADDTKPTTAEELIAKHLAAVGTPEARAAAKSCGIDGGAAFNFKNGGGGGESRGSVRMASEARKMHLMIELGTPNYTGEDVVSDGSKLNIAGFVAGKKSMLGAFLDQRPEVVREGLLGGVLTTGWALLDVDGRKPKLKFNGLKTVDGKELYELRYEPKKVSGDVQIRLYFDPATYRHVMTVYEAVIPVPNARSINPNSNAAQNGMASQEGHQMLKETFGNFKSLDGETIPSEWTIEMTNDVESTAIMKWSFLIRSAVHAPIDPAAFKTK